MNRVEKLIVIVALVLCSVTCGVALCLQPEQPPPVKMRGAKPSPQKAILKASPFEPKAVAQVAPAQFGVVCPKYLLWGNDTYGDCVSAEEAANIAITSHRAGKDTVISNNTVINWARQHGYLNGAALTDVMDSMARTGMTEAGTVYTDGPYKRVDFKDRVNLCSAIFQAPVKIGVAANQLESVHTSHNGWWLVHGYRDQAIDHCVNLCGYGPASYLAKLCGVEVPASVKPDTFCYLLYTWGSVGILDEATMVGITGEAWIRNPTSLANGKPFVVDDAPAMFSWPHVVVAVGLLVLLAIAIAKYRSKAAPAAALLLLCATQLQAADKLVVISANWCGPCRQLHKSLEANELAEPLAKYHVYHLNVDQCPSIAAKYKARALPTLVVLDNDNKELKRHTGYLSPAQLKAWLK